MSQFATPANGAKPRDLLGHLVIARPTSYETEIPTINGTKDAVAVDAADLDTGEIHLGCLWFNGPIVGRLKRHIGDIVIGHILEGRPNPGQQAPIMFVYANEDPAAVAKGQAFMAANPGFGKAADPAPTAPAPAPAPAAPAPRPAAVAPAPAVTPAAPAPAGGLTPELLAQLPADTQALVAALQNNTAA